MKLVCRSSLTMLVVLVSSTNCEPQTPQPPEHPSNPVVCRSGYYVSIGTSSCLPCPYGTTTPGGTLSECTRCPVNTYAIKSMGAGSCMQCPPGRFTEHTGSGAVQECRCGRGYYWAVYTPMVPTGCVMCGPGTLNPDGVDVHSCKPCSVGYVTRHNKTSCQQCPPGETTSGAGDNICYCIPPTFRTSNATGCSTTPEKSLEGPQKYSDIVLASGGRGLHPTGIIWFVVAMFGYRVMRM